MLNVSIFPPLPFPAGFQCEEANEWGLGLGSPSPPWQGWLQGGLWPPYTG